MQHTIDVSTFEEHGVSSSLDIAQCNLIPQESYTTRASKFILWHKLLEAKEQVGWSEHTCDWDTHFIIHSRKHGFIECDFIAVEGYWPRTTFDDPKNANITVECYIDGEDTPRAEIHLNDLAFIKCEYE